MQPSSFSRIQPSIARNMAGAALFGLAFFAGAYAAPPVTTDATFAVIVDHESGEVLFDKSGDVPTAPASMSKLMTVAVVLEKVASGELSLDQPFDVSEKAWRMGGSKMWVRVDTQIRLRDLLRGVIVQSGNDACIVIAENISGSEDAFAELMNRKAREWGLDDSTFANATGWPDPRQKMSMRDLATLARKIIREHPEHYAIFAEREFTWEKITQSNRNPLLDGSSGADGLKTGHTEESGFGVVGSAVRDGVRRIVVVNGLADERARLTESRRLMDIAFNDFVVRRLYEDGDKVGDAMVFAGREATAPLVVAGEVEFIVHRKLVRDITARVRYEGPIAAPVRKGEQVGVLEVLVDEEVRTYPVFAGADVREVGFFGKVGVAARKLLLKPEKAVEPDVPDAPEDPAQVGV